jgi:hypothetical protein
VAELEDGKVPAQRVFHGACAQTIIDSSPFVVRTSSKVTPNNDLPLDLLRVRENGDVIVGSDEAALGVQAEACTELAFYPESYEF